MMKSSSMDNVSPVSILLSDNRIGLYDGRALGDFGDFGVCGVFGVVVVDDDDASNDGDDMEDLDSRGGGAGATTTLS